LTCCSTLIPLLGWQCQKEYIYTHNWKGGKQPLRMQWTKKGSWGTRSDEDLHGSWMYLPNMIVICAQPLFGCQTWIWSKRTMAIYNLTPGQSFEKSEHVPAVQPLNHVPTLSPCYKYPPPI
jgi:hypothetical protein